MVKQHKQGMSQRDLFFVGGALVLILGVAYLLGQGSGATVDPGKIEVSTLEDDRLYTGVADEYDDSAPKSRPERKPLPPEELKPIAPLPQAPNLRVYFNQNHASTYTDPYRQIRRYGDDLEAIVVAEVNKAQTSLDLAVHELNLPHIAQAIAARSRAGVRVRLIMENAYTRDVGQFTPTDLAQLNERDRDRAEQLRRYIDIDNDGRLTPAELAERDALYILNQQGVPWIDDTADGSKGSGIMHDKYLLIDGQTLITGSTNLTYSDVHGDRDAPDTRGNNNNLLVITSPALVALYRRDFEQMWGDGPGGLPDSRFGSRKTPSPLVPQAVGDIAVAVQFSPMGARVPQAMTTNGSVAQALSEATASVHLALFVFSSQELTDTLAALHQSRPGVEIAGVFDPGFSYRAFSETLDLWGVSLPDRNCTLEANNHPWTQPLRTIGVPVLPVGDKLHHKFAVVDGRIVITGSHNWTQAANRQNDENTLFIDSPVVAAHYEREFARLYRQSLLRPSRKLLEQVAQVATRCPTVTAKPTGKAEPTAPTPINSATPADLKALPGIGPVTARALVEYRTAHGPFHTLEDLQQVKGFGPKTVLALAGRVRFD
ncbi:phospholipase D-like domain-containing protein [Anthocerotibacter panamensis]|uniref:phospholipase D-like domain-containing protein n=1 Tax=Anthocerotibacter panamensis TaxID=2857077 RepID=UPI001C404F31|nr:phospholipase D-like domain-containing protein [Anthocerotibacter panamensis]